MRTRLSVAALRALPALLATLALHGVGAEEPAREAAAEPPLRVEGALDVRGNGDVASDFTVTLPPAAWERVVAAVPEPADLLRLLRLLRPGARAYELAAPPDLTFDPAARAIRVRDVQLGAAQNLGEGRWALALPPGLLVAPPPAAEPVPGPSERPVLWAVAGTAGAPALAEQRWRIALPPGAVAGASAGALVRWSTPGARVPPGAAGVSGRLRARGFLCATAYRAYADEQVETADGTLWVGRLLLTNRGPGLARNLRVRFRLAGWSEWSPWQRHPEVVPGQHVAARFHPLLDARLVTLQAATQADVLAEWTWEDGTGLPRRDEAAARLTIVGLNDFVPKDHEPEFEAGSTTASRGATALLAAWVSRSDPPIAELAAMANRVAGGLGARSGDEAALRVLGACYDLLRRNDVRYLVSPVGEVRLPDGSLRFLQRVRLPRDTVRDRAGSCIDLAVLYAALAHGVGLEPGVLLVPGHALPTVRLPSGRLVAVEATGVSGGLDYGSRPFDEVLREGTESLEAWKGDGRGLWLDLPRLWSQGVLPPDLPALEADVLARWGWRPEGLGRPLTPVPARDPLLGLWKGTLTPERGPGPWEATLEVRANRRLGFVARLSARGPLPTTEGQPADAQGELEAEYRGPRASDGYELTAVERALRLSAGAGALPLGPGRLVLRLQGDRLEGRSRGPEGPGSPPRTGGEPADALLRGELELARVEAPAPPPAAPGFLPRRQWVEATPPDGSGFVALPGGGALAASARDATERWLLARAKGTPGAGLDSVVWQELASGVPVALFALELPGSADVAATRASLESNELPTVAQPLGDGSRWVLIVSRSPEVRDRARAAWREQLRPALQRGEQAALAAGHDAGPWQRALQGL